jgi:hypothetical protein
MGRRAQALGDRIEQGARALAAFTETLSEAEWRTPIPRDGRTVGVVVHHVAAVYPIEIELAKTIAAGRDIENVTWEVVAKLNADHASTHVDVGKAEALDALRRNSKAAADAVRLLTDEELDRAGSVSLNGGAPLTTQFLVEDHALRHSYHHLARIRAAIGR